VIHYQGITDVALTVNTYQWTLMLADGTVGLTNGSPAFNFRIPAGQQGVFTYDVNDLPGGDVLMMYTNTATGPSGTLTVTWTYTDDNGSTGTITATANVIGS
jgi:hypothetical protein